MEPPFAVTISGDHRFYEQLRRGNDITIKTPKNCKRCKRHSSQRPFKFISRRSSSTTSMPERHAWRPNPLHEDDISLISEPVNCTMGYVSSEPSEKRTNVRNSAKESLEKIFRSPCSKKNAYFGASTSVPPFIVVNIPKNQNFQRSSNETSTVVSEGIKCRYCYNIEDENLITPCRCSGSSKYVHKSCLEKWLTLKNRNECEICKAKYKIRSSFNPIWALKFPSMDKRDATLLLVTVSFYITLILQFLGAVFIGVSEPTAIPAMMRHVTLTGLSFGLFWFLVGAICLTIVVYTSRYWEEFRKMNRQKTLILENCNIYKISPSTRSMKTLDLIKSGSVSNKLLPNESQEMKPEACETKRKLSTSVYCFQNGDGKNVRCQNSDGKSIKCQSDDGSMREKSNEDLSSDYVTSYSHNEGCISVSVDFETKNIRHSKLIEDKGIRHSKLFDDKSIRHSKLVDDKSVRHSRYIEDKNVRHSKHFEDQTRCEAHSLGRRSRRSSSRSFKRDESMLPVDLSLAVAV